MSIDPGVRRSLLLAVGGAILALLAVAAAGPAPGGTSGQPAESANVTTVEPVAERGEIWPYTSRAPRFGARTLPLNVIVRGDQDRVRREFRRRAAADWSTAGASTDRGREGTPAIGEDAVVWLPAHGATRYTYFRTGDGGTWAAQDYQLYEGDYLGVRHHLRAYEAPGGNWTAMQGHAEYWDWFRLRHTVTSTADTRRTVDAQFAGDARVASVERLPLDNPGGTDGDGFATVVTFAPLAWVVFVGLVRIRARAASRPWPANPRRVAGLAAAVAGLYLGVRAGGVLLEAWLAWLHPKVVAGALYPALAVGLPAVAATAARRVRPGVAFLGGCAGLATGLAAEYVVLDLSVLPVVLVLHRVALVLAIGLVAAAGALSAAEGDDWHGILGLGVGGWALALGLALFGLL